MNFGTICSLTTSGPLSARNLPAAAAASPASGTSASCAASQLPAATDFISDCELDFLPSPDPLPFSEPFDRESSTFFTATAAAPVAAAAAAALTAVRVAFPLCSLPV